MFWYNTECFFKKRAMTEIDFGVQGWVRMKPMNQRSLNNNRFTGASASDWRGRQRVCRRVSTVGTLVFLLCMAGTSIGLSQRYLVHTYSEEEGLPSSTIYQITQDSHDRIWFATRGGIAVYDGLNWMHYTFRNGLPNVAFIGLRADKKGGIWALAAGNRGLFHFTEEKGWTSFPVLPKFNNRVYRTTAFELVTLEGRTILATGTNGQGVFLWDHGDWRNIREEDGLPSDMINGIAAAGECFYLATERGVAVLHGARVVRDAPEQQIIPADEILGIGAETMSDSLEGLSPGIRLWVHGPDWLGLYAEAEFKILLPDDPVAIDESNPGLLVQPDSRGGVIYGNPLRLYEYLLDDGVRTELDKAAGLMAEGANTLLLDRERNIWIGGFRGASKIASRRFACYSNNDGLLDDEVTALLEVAPGWLLMGHNDGLTSWKNRVFRTLEFKGEGATAVQEARVMDLARDDSGRIWAAISAHGLARIHDDFRVSIFPLNLPGDQSLRYPRQAHCLCPVAKNELWVGTNDGLLIFDGSGFRRKEFAGFKLRNVRRIIRGGDGRVYATVGGMGIIVIDGADCRHYSLGEAPFENEVYSMILDQQGRLWAGTLVGLFIIHAGTVERCTVEQHGLAIQRPVYMIQEDWRGGLWFGTDNGVFFFDEKMVRHFSLKDGFMGREINRAASLVDQRGDVWIGSDLGLCRYQSRYDLRAEDIPPPHIELHTLEAGRRSFPASQPLSLAHDEHSLVFRFRVLSFVDEHQIGYRHRLEGFEMNWSPVRPYVDDSVRYDRLPPGEYRFYIQAQNAVGGWSDVVASPTIHIMEPFWRRWWFFLLASFVLAGLMLAVHRHLVTRRYSADLERKVREKTERLREKQAALATSLHEKEVLLREIHHRVKNNLQIVTSMLSLQAMKVNDPVLQKLYEESTLRLTTMARLHEKLYRSENLGVLDFKDYIQSLVEDIVSIHGARARRIEVDIDAEPVLLEIEQAVQCGLILNELVSNALVHAFDGRDSGKIRIGFANDAAGNTIFTIEDDGSGLPKDFRLDQVSTLGMRLVRSLVEQLGGTMSIHNDPGATFIIRFQPKSGTCPTNPPVA